MTPITKILVPVDLSARSLGAATYAASLAAEFGPELVFLHALQNGWPLAEDEGEIRDRVNATPGAHRFLFREGSPAPVILETAEAERADLILIPTRGKPALARFIDGSIAAQVLRGAHCPVWIGLDNLSPLSSRPIRNILCGLSLGPRASAVLRWSADLAKRLDASLSVIHASKALESNPGSPGDEEWRFWLKKMARDEIRTLQDWVGTDAEVWLESGRPLATILPLADQLRADLLVIGKSPQKRFLGDLRTLSYEIACQTSCPVASV
ncbi:MAG: universal stress protein [Acidobacteriia bacterium]|nr:universal stress protein [Terriglobia bacterium]